MKWIVCLIGSLCCAGIAKTQSADSTMEIVYTDSNFNEISKDSAYGFYEIKSPISNLQSAVRRFFTLDSTLLSYAEFGDYENKEYHGVVRKYYENGNIKLESVYLDDKLEGTYRKYYESGQLKMSANYSNGELDGEVKCYYSNGNLKREEEFINDISKGGRCFTISGKDTACCPFNVAASYPGGDGAFTSWLQNEFEYPSKMYKAKEGGKVMIRFAIDKQGNVTNVKITESTNPLMDQEALRVMAKAKPWTPGYFEGEPIKAFRQVPIVLNMN